MRKRIVFFELPDATQEQLESIRRGLERLVKEDNLPYVFVISNKPFGALTRKERKSLLEEAVKRFDRP